MHQIIGVAVSGFGLIIFSLIFAVVLIEKEVRSMFN